jgi:glucose-1-phosphate cytidylyltransferase
MKAVILAGGLYTRTSEETHLKPKPMVKIGGKPILWYTPSGFIRKDVTPMIRPSGGLRT